MFYGGTSAISNEYRGLLFKCSKSQINSHKCIYPQSTNYTITGEELLKQRGFANTQKKILKKKKLKFMKNFCIFYN